MTENQAKELWCPETHTRINVVFMKKDDLTESEINTLTEERVRSNCVASGCAMWVSDGGTMGHCGLINS